MDIFLQNTLSGKKEKFVPIKNGEVSMYNCGPTVYDYAHIGNFRTFILNDLLRRLFEYSGYKVNQVMNITDVDDKTINRSREENITLGSLTRRYEEIFLNDLKSLNILEPTKTPRATENIHGMISMIENLIEKGLAYKANDGVYFDITKSKNYGELARLNLENIPKERISNDEYDKANPRDFALWKFYTEADGEVSYEASFGKGRPGWHIECSTMSIEELGETIDIHTGGQDIIFPHHTNEIAQSEGSTGKHFVNYWVHGGFITVDGKKMSKSLGNIITIETLLEKNIDPLVYRYFVLGAHYSTLLNFNWEILQSCETALKRIRTIVQNADMSGESNPANIDKFKNLFEEYIHDDLDMPKVLALIFDLIKDSNVSELDKRNLILDFDKVLGLELNKVENIEIPEDVQKLIVDRDRAREEKDFAKSDQLRKEIESFGFEVMDTPDGTKVQKR